MEAIKELISLEHELEISKQNLALRADFNLYDAFKIFDPTNYGSVALIDIQDAFNAYGVFISREESDLILQRYDNNKDARLSFAEFSSMFTPQDRSSAQVLQARRGTAASYPRQEIFVGITRDYFASLLRLHINVEAYAERIRQRISLRPLFNKSEAFNTLDWKQASFVTKDQFSDLLARHRFFATQNELNTIMDRFDKDKDGKVSYHEFVEEMTPHSPAKF